MTADDEPTPNGPDDLASDGWRPPPVPKLTAEHVKILRCAERAELPDIGRTWVRIALDECRRWNLVRSSSCTLTPAGADALARSRNR